MREMPVRCVKRSELSRLIMAACADDYEEYSMIVSEIAKWTKDSPDAPNVYQIEEALLESIANKDIDVYEVYEGRLRLTTAPPNHERIGELWFYVSEQGKTWVRGIDPIEIGSISTSECE